MDEHRIKFGNNAVMIIRELLTPHRRRFTRLQRLLDRSDRQDAWTRELRAVLPDGLRTACRAVEIRGDTLVVACDDGAVATRVRFEAAEIVRQLNVLNRYKQVTRLDVRVSRTGRGSE